MKKYLTIISFILISLLAIGAASAADNNNMTGDSHMSVPSEEVDVLEMDLADNEKYGTPNDLNNPENILSDDEKDTPNVNVDNSTAIEGENVTISFNVTDSKGSLISGEANVTISGENQTISKSVKINTDSSQYKITDLIEIIKANDKWNISDAYNIINSSMNSTDGNISEIIIGFGDVFNGLNLNISRFASGMVDIINGSDVNTSQLMDGLEIISNGINISMLMDGLYDMVNVSNLNFSTLAKAFDVFIGGFNLDLPNIINNIYKCISFNKKLLMEGISSLSSELGSSQENSIEDSIGNIGLDYSLGIVLKAVSILSKNTISLQEIFGLFKDILDYNNLTLADFIERTSSQNTESDFNFTNFINKISALNSNNANIVNAADKIIKSIIIDYTLLNSVISDIEKCTFNSSKVINELADLDGTNMFNNTNTSNIIGGMYNVIMDSISDTSSIIEGLIKVVSSFKIHIPNSMAGLNKICSSFSYNNSTVMNGLNKIINGLGIDISSIMGKIIAKYGYFVIFSDSLDSGVYNVSVEYLSNEYYNSAVNDTAKLTVLNKKDVSIVVDAVVNGQNVVLTGNVGSNATNIVLLIINDYSIVVPVINGNFTYKSSFTPDDYNIMVLYFDNMKFNNASVSFTVKAPTQIIASTVSTTYGTSKNLVITLKDAAGNALKDKKVNVILNGNQYSRQTNAQGQISIAVPNTLTPNTYTASIAFAGDNKYIQTMGTAKVVVSKAKSAITAKKKTFKVKTKTKKYEITLKNDKGKAITKTKVTLKIKGKTYTAKTDAKGKATFKIKKLTKKGKHQATIKFAGNKYYNAVTKKVKITVK